MPKTPPPLTWLASLKTSHLKTIARATGTPNAGRKEVLCERIGSEIEKSVFLYNNLSNSSGGGGSKKNETMSVLSIDMGIQNLAFAHLLVRPATEKKNNIEVVLDAWHRVGVQELSVASEDDDDNKNNNNTNNAGLPPSAFRTLTRKASAATQHKSKSKSKSKTLTETQNETNTQPGNENSEKNFSPDILANNAYTLLSRLIAQYNPTHILIERQRFRSGGQTAVLEWSLRVGVFEGMLHAVLCTMRRLGHCAAKVWDVSPARVAQYWESSSSSNNSSKLEELETTKAAEKVEKNQGNIKKMKINIIGQWLNQVSSSSSSASTLPEKYDEAEPNPHAKIIILPSKKPPSDVHDTVTAYLERWSGKRSSATQWRIEKLDDLADCLLQGMTWLEWQVRRAHLARDGLQELARMGVSVDAKGEKRKKSTKK